MVAKESPPNSADHHQEQDQDSYEEEETLSFCDLPIHNYGDSFKWDDGEFSGSSKKYQSSASNDDDEEEEDFFEFFSEEFTATTYSNHKEIIFCGKVFPLAGQDQKTDDRDVKSGEKVTPEKPRRKQSLFHYLVKPRSNDGRALASSDNNKDRVKVAKVSVMGSPAVKSKWHLFMFGMVGVPAEMELRDMRTRQNRRRTSHSATMFPSFDEEGKEETTVEKASSKPRRRKSGKGFWGLLRALGCLSRHAEVVAKAAYGCSAIPRE